VEGRRGGFPESFLTGNYEEVVGKVARPLVVVRELLPAACVVFVTAALAASRTHQSHLILFVRIF